MRSRARSSSIACLVAAGLTLARPALAADPPRPGPAKAKPAEKAADPVADALKLLDQGIELFKQDKLEEARTAFIKVRGMVPDKANPYRWLGLAEARLGHCKEAVESLDEFIKRVPGNDSRTIEAVTVRDRCREDLIVKMGTIVVESSPTGAELRLDKEESQPLGATPYRGDVVVGSHVVILRKEGHQPVSKVFTIGKGETVRLDVNLPIVPAVVAGGSTDAATPGGAGPPPKKSKLWVLGIVGGVVAAGALGLGLGLGLSGSQPTEPVFPSVVGF